MTTTLLVLQFILTIILTIAVLLQKSSSIGLGAYSGSNESLFGAKGPDSFLAKFTFAIGAAFIINTIALGYLYNKENKNSIAETITIDKVVPNVTVPEAPKVDGLPKEKRVTTSTSEENKSK